MSNTNVNLEPTMTETITVTRGVVTYHYLVLTDVNGEQRVIGRVCRW